MKLSQEQIQQIDYILCKHYTFEKFDDVRMELLDHIASDVEAEMNTNQLSFEDTLPKVLFKWKTEISWDRNSRYDSVPNIISRFWKKLDWKYNYSAIPLTLLVSIVFLYFRKEEVIGYIIIYGIAFFAIVISFYLIKLKRANKFNTVLSMYAGNNINRYVFILIFGIITNIGFNIYDGNMKSIPTLWIIIHTAIVVILKTVLMRKNIKIENQLLRVL